MVWQVGSRRVLTSGAWTVRIVTRRGPSQYSGLRTLHIVAYKVALGSWCWRVEDVVSVLTLVRREAAQVCDVLRAEELREQLELEEEEEGKEDGQEEEDEVESGEGRVKEKQPPHTWMTMDESEMR